MTKLSDLNSENFMSATIAIAAVSRNASRQVDELAINDTYFSYVCADLGRCSQLARLARPWAEPIFPEMDNEIGV